MFYKKEESPSQQTAKTAAPRGEQRPKEPGIRLGERVWACQDWGRSMGTPSGALEGRVVYLDPKGYWLTVRGPHYQESFSVQEIARDPQGAAEKAARSGGRGRQGPSGGRGGQAPARRGPYNKRRTQG